MYMLIHLYFTSLSLTLPYIPITTPLSLTALMYPSPHHLLHLIPHPSPSPLHQYISTQLYLSLHSSSPSLYTTLFLSTLFISLPLALSFILPSIIYYVCMSISLDALNILVYVSACMECINNVNSCAYQLNTCSWKKVK